MRTPEVESAMDCAAKSLHPRLHRYMEYHTAVITLAAEVERLEDLHRMQLAGISTATLQNTVASTADRILKDNPYWTIAYGDVCTAVDREIAQRVRAEAAEARVAELEAQNARLRAALEDIAAYDVGSRHAGTCPYGCDTPAIAQNTLAAEAGRARAATKALADGKAAP